MNTTLIINMTPHKFPLTSSEECVLSTLREVCIATMKSIKVLSNKHLFTFSENYWNTYCYFNAKLL